MMPKLLPRKTVLFRYTGPDEQARRFGLAHLVYEEDGRYFAVDTLEEVQIDLRKYTRSEEHGRLQSWWLYFGLWLRGAPAGWRKR